MDDPSSETSPPGRAMTETERTWAAVRLAATASARGPGDLATDDTLAGPAGSPESVRRSEAVHLRRGALVGRYVVLRELGQGAMGVVYAAEDPELDRKIALKLLRPEVGGTATSGGTMAARTRLLREAQALARLAHPNVVAVHDVGEHEGSVWLAMELVDGETLSVWLRGRRRGWREVLDVMTAAGRGLAAAHAAGLLHRDFKPESDRLLHLSPSTREMPRISSVEGPGRKSRLTRADSGHPGLTRFLATERPPLRRVDLGSARASVNPTMASEGRLRRLEARSGELQRPRAVDHGGPG